MVTTQQKIDPVAERKELEESLAVEKREFGFTSFAERLNGRLAMLGFVVGVLTELLTGQGILSQIGLM